MARSAANSTNIESPFQDVPSTPRVWRRTAESPAGIVPDLSLLQQHPDTAATPGRYQSVPRTPTSPGTPRPHIRPPYHLIARMRVSTTPVVTKSPQSDQVVPVHELHLERRQGLQRKRPHHQSPPPQLQQAAVSNPDADFWDVFSGISAVSVNQDSLPVFSYDYVRQVTVLAMPGEADVICDMTDCDEDYINPHNKLQREPTKTTTLKHLANEVAARQGNTAAWREHGPEMEFKYSYLQSSRVDAVNVDGLAEGVKKEDVNMLETSQSVIPNGGEVPSVPARKRRSIRNVAFFRRAFRNIGLKGRVLYTAKKVTQLKFRFDGAQFHDITSDDVMLADLRLYQRAQQRRRQHGRRRRHRVVTVRVSIHQIISRNRRFPRAKLIDSSLLHIGNGGWVSFNLTAAVRDWLSPTPTPTHTNKGLEVWAETVKGGSKAARAVRKLKFVSAGSKKRKAKSPAVVLYLRTVK